MDFSHRTKERWSKTGNPVREPTDRDSPLRRAELEAATKKYLSLLWREKNRPLWPSYAVKDDWD